MEPNLLFTAAVLDQSEFVVLATRKSRFTVCFYFSWLWVSFLQKLVFSSALDGKEEEEKAAKVQMSEVSSFRGASSSTEAFTSASIPEKFDYGSQFAATLPHHHLKF